MIFHSKISLFVLFFVNILTGINCGICPRRPKFQTKSQLEVFPQDSFGNCLMLTPTGNTEFKAVFSITKPVNSSELRSTLFVQSLNVLDDDDSIIVNVTLPVVNFSWAMDTRTCLGLIEAKCGEMLKPNQNYTLHQAILQGTWLPGPGFAHGAFVIATSDNFLFQQLKFSDDLKFCKELTCFFA